MITEFFYVLVVFCEKIFLVFKLGFFVELKLYVRGCVLYFLVRFFVRGYGRFVVLG